MLAVLFQVLMSVNIFVGRKHALTRLGYVASHNFPGVLKISDLVLFSEDLICCSRRMAKCWTVKQFGLCLFFIMLPLLDITCYKGVFH